VNTATRTGNSQPPFVQPVCDVDPIGPPPKGSSAPRLTSARDERGMPSWEARPAPGGRPPASPFPGQRQQEADRAWPVIAGFGRKYCDARRRLDAERRATVHGQPAAAVGRLSTLALERTAAAGSAVVKDQSGFTLDVAQALFRSLSHAPRSMMRLTRVSYSSCNEFQSAP